MAHRKELTAIVLVFVLALEIRLIYQAASVVDTPIRADSAKYVDAAYNLRHFGVYSLDRPRKDNRPPQSNTDLAPGYPLFISLFLHDNKLWGSGILKVQAVMGSLVSVSALLLARMALPFPWAVAAGIMTAASPHLVAMDGYFLSESLFTFILMCGIVLTALTWRYRRYSISFAAGLILALSSQVRAVSLLLPFFLALAFLFTAEGKRPLAWKTIGHSLCFAIAFLTIAGAHKWFMRAVSIPQQAAMVAMAPHKGFRDVGKVIRGIQFCLIPPEFFIQGVDHVYARHGHREYRNPTKTPFQDRPLRYLQWGLYAKLITMWHWDDLFNGDVYIYPMLRKGFEENMFLKTVHRSMRILHWPLFFLAMAALPMFWVRRRLKMQPDREGVLLIPAMAFVYFLLLLWLISWITRYTIPVRPVSYVLACASLYWLWSSVGNRFPNIRGTA
ncbi:MAG: hypothetical protein ACOZF0_23575 [Thermodesulfobacteriota bacterium]